MAVFSVAPVVFLHSRLAHGAEAGARWGNPVFKIGGVLSSRPDSRMEVYGLIVERLRLFYG
jgi:hypothetical protein